MRVFLRKILIKLLAPLLKYWGRQADKKTQETNFLGLKLLIPPHVFHPSWFFSSKILAKFALALPLKDKKVLEIGCGSGAISLTCAKAGAKVTAIDISEDALKATEENAKRNALSLVLHLSDLYQSLPLQTFDYILVNPPYYPKNPQNSGEKAWFCGAEFEYFHAFFQGLKSYTNAQTQIYMVLSEDCQIAHIQTIGSENGWQMKSVYSEIIWLEKNEIFAISANA